MMKLPLTGAQKLTRPHAGEAGAARTVVLALSCFVAGASLSAAWFYSHKTKPSHAVATDQDAGLSPLTMAALSTVKEPVEVRFYSLLDAKTVEPSVVDFAGRIDRLLAAFERHAEGKIRVARSVAYSDPALKSAAADGLAPFNRERGEVSYLGIAVSRGSRTDALAQLSPQWEAAVQYDLARAIIRASGEPPAPASTELSLEPDPQKLESVRRVIPDPQTVSVEDGTRLLREAAMKEFTAAVSESQTRLREAQERLAKAQQNGTAAEQETAIRELQETQAEQTRKLKEIAAAAEARMQAFRFLRATNR
jgi:hypothetical protein